MTTLSQNEKYINLLEAWIRAAEKETINLDTSGFVHDIKPVVEEVKNYVSLGLELNDVFPEAENISITDETAHRAALFVSRCKDGVRLLHGHQSNREIGGTRFSKHHTYIKQQYADSLSMAAKISLGLPK